MLVFRQVDQVRKIAEGPDDLGSLVIAQVVQRRLQLLARGDIRIALETYRALAYLLYQFKNLLAVLATHGIAKYAAQPAYIFPQ